MSLWSRRQLLGSASATAAASILPDIAEGREAPDGAMRERLLFDTGWRFHLGHADDLAQDFGFGHGGDQAAEYGKSGELFSMPRGFDDSNWREVQLPHDWAVELPYVNAVELNDFGDHPLGRNYPATSIGWYRRAFTLPASDAGRRISLEFDGIFRDALIAINGHLVGRNFSGYAPYRADVTDLVTVGGSNELVVRVDATQHEGWFYEGAGIYRHVWMVKTSPLHVAHWGTFVTSTVTGARATVTVISEIENESDAAATCHLRQTIADGGNKVVAEGRSTPVAVPAWGRVTVHQELTVANPRLWSIESPSMYSLRTTVETGTSRVDDYLTPFGIRTMRVDPARGFLLNGQRVEIKGTCNHQDHAGVGSALPDRLQYYRIERLKEMGSNAYRTSHNPPTPELLDACDRLGMLVLDENRTFSSEEEGMSQLERLVRRDRNHPCVFAWSLANEEGADQGNARGERIITSMRRLVHQIDPTRPVTAAMNGQWGKGFTHVVDVQGFNYFLGNIDQIHRDFPSKPLLGTEVASTLGTRGIYANDPARGYMSAYDVNKPGWGATAEEWWTYFAARPFLAGGFVWTGFDYRGEPTPYKWPCTSSHFGIMDTCGFPKDNFYYYQAWWGDQPVLHLFPHWNWSGREQQEIEVWAHGNCDRVELFVNGASVGVRTMERNRHVSWRVPFVAGAIEARGFVGDKQVTVSRRETTGAPAAIALDVDRARMAADGEDVAVVGARVVDATGRTVPVADDVITFSVTGAGKVIGVGNGDPSSHEPDKATVRRAFNGRCCALVQALRTAGLVHIEASAPGLRSATAEVQSEQVGLRASVP